MPSLTKCISLVFLKQCAYSIFSTPSTNERMIYMYCIVQTKILHYYTFKVTMASAALIRPKSVLVFIGYCLILVEPRCLSVTWFLEPQTLNLNNNPLVTYRESLHLHLWSIQLTSQAKWRAQWFWCVIGGGCPCVETSTLLAQFHLVTRALSLHAADSVKSQRQHLGEGESLSGLRLSAVLLLVAPEVPTASSVAVPVWRQIWEQSCCCCCCLAIRERAQTPSSEPITALTELIMKYGHWRLQWAAPGLFFHLMFDYDMFKY